MQRCLQLSTATFRTPKDAAPPNPHSMPVTHPSDNEVTANQLAVGTAQHTSIAKSLVAQFGLGDSSDDGEDAQEQEQDLKRRDL